MRKTRHILPYSIDTEGEFREWIQELSELETDKLAELVTKHAVRDAEFCWMIAFEHNCRHYETAEALRRYDEYVTHELRQDPDDGNHIISCTEILRAMCGQRGLKEYIKAFPRVLKRLDESAERIIGADGDVSFSMKKEAEEWFEQIRGAVGTEYPGLSSEVRIELRSKARAAADKFRPGIIDNYLELLADLIDEAEESLMKHEREKGSWNTITMDDILMALEAADDEYRQCYDFRTGQTLIVGGDFDSFREGFLNDLARDHPEAVIQLLAKVAESEELPMQEAFGQEFNLEEEKLEAIVDSFDREMLDWLEEIYLEDCPAFPDRYDIHEYGIMERFIGNETEGDFQERLRSVIQGRGAFRRFRRELEKRGAENRWYDYRDREYVRIAREWAENNQIRVIE